VLLSSLEEGDIAGADLMTLTIAARNPAISFDDDPELAEACNVSVDDSARFDEEEMSVRFS
jgi:hypothetical protein